LQIGFLKMTGRSLNSVELVPPDVLLHLGRVIECEPPRIASIRAFYRRRRTLFEHQAAARALLRRSEVSEHGLRGLTAFLRREAIRALRHQENVVFEAVCAARDRGYLPDRTRGPPSDDPGLAPSGRMSFRAACREDAKRCAGLAEATPGTGPG
jgi:hypothetical protein